MPPYSGHCTRRSRHHPQFPVHSGVRRRYVQFVRRVRYLLNLRAHFFLLTHSYLQRSQQLHFFDPSQASHSLSSLLRCTKYWDLGKAIPSWRLWLSLLGVQRKYHFVSGIDLWLSRPLGRFCFGSTASEYGTQADTLASLRSRLRGRSPARVPYTS